ncbi:hypothetical protein K1T71_013180 [Dendrolimus kikuchii]|uniref:Uncharacterized protein n=1 Tax=Dendrolimus kikuchii TaxID=765133 RepID=A0ACC1CJ91_9NEOP|nr:hypothetical protein K1T71_013180 [Dendrolimus kikuchii]
MVYTISNHCQSVEITNDIKESVWREIFISLVVSIPFFTHGVETTTLTASIHSGHFIQHDGVPWSTTALILATCIAPPLYCYLIDRYGRRLGMFCVSFVQGASLIPLFLLNDTSIIILHVIVGISSGGLFTVLPIYIREICSSKTRGYTLVWIMVMTTLGYMMKLVTSLEERSYLMVLLVMMQFVMMMFVMETPAYLVMKDKVEVAKCNISRLKGLHQDDPEILKLISDLNGENDRAKLNGKFSTTTLYRNKIWWDGAKVSVVLFTTMTLCGSIVFLDQQKTLMQLKNDVDPQNLLVLGSMMAGAVCSVAFVAFLDRKYLLTFGYATMALASGVVAVYTQVDLTISSYRWVPVAALTVLVFGYGICWAIPVIITVEIFNMRIRATLLGIIFSYSQVLKLCHVQTFQYIEDYVGVYTLFYIFSCINLYGAVYTLFVAPNLKGKSLRQIEKQLKRTPLPA